MPCTPFQSGTARGFICTRGRPRPKRCACGSGLAADLLCDWKDKTKANGTCSAKICAACTHVPAPDKDLCPTHAAEWKARQAMR